MECIKCGNHIGMTDKYFALSDVLSHNESNDFFLCEECAAFVTPMELYMVGKIRMANADDDSIEVDAVVVKEKPDHPTSEEIAAAEYQLEKQELASEYDTHAMDEIYRAIRECDTREEFLARFPGYDEEWDAAVEGK